MASLDPIKRDSLLLLVQPLFIKPEILILFIKWSVHVYEFQMGHAIVFSGLLEKPNVALR